MENNTPTIQSGIRIPAPETTSRGRKPHFPLDELSVGHSFFVPTTSKKKIQSVRASVYSANRRKKPKMFCIDKVTGGVRVWRVNDRTEERTVTPANLYQIDHNVPMPTPAKSTGRKRKYPFADMQVGDSFFIETDNPNKTQKNVLGAGRAGRFSTYRFTTRQVDGGVRVWRVS